MVSDARQSVYCSSPQFETLEDRLLLTTLYGGDSFIYLNSQGNQIRIDITGEGSAVEFFSLDGGQGGLVDLVGAVNRGGQGWDYDTYDWGLQPIMVSENNLTRWVEYRDGTVASQLNIQAANVRGARTEIYAIYIAAATEDTVITLSQLASDTWGVPVTNWSTNIDPWLSSTLPLIPGVTGYVSAPANSGAVVIGAYRSDPNATTLRFVTDRDTSMTAQFTDLTLIDPNTMCPDNIALRPGITVSSEAYSPINLNNGLGSQVDSIAAIDRDNLRAILQGFTADMQNRTASGALGNLTNLTSDGLGTFYTINGNGAQREYINRNQSLPANFAALTGAADGSAYYGFNPATRQLVRIDPGTSVVSTIGILRWHADATWQYQNLTAMDMSSDGNIYAVATVVDTEAGNPAPQDPARVRLIQIDPGSGQVTAEWTFATPPNIGSLSFNAAGTLYGVTNNGRLVGIDNSGANATLVGGTQLTLNGVNQLGWQGIEFVGNTLYGITADRLYLINVDDGTCTDVGATGVAGMTAINYDPTRPGWLYVSGQHPTNPSNLVLARMSIAPTLQSFFSNGVSEGFRGMMMVNGSAYLHWGRLESFDYSDADGMIYAVGRQGSLDSIGNAANNANYYLVVVDPGTGAVTEIGLTADGGVTVPMIGISFDSTGVAWGLSAANKLYTIDLATGGVTHQGDLDAGEALTAIDFTVVNGNTVLYGLSGSNVYAINFVAGVDPIGTCRLLGGTGRTDLTSLAFDASLPNSMWTLSQVNGSYRLMRLDMGGTLLAVNASSQVTRWGVLTDFDNASWAYTNVHGLTYYAGQLYGVATIVNLDPFGAADSPDTGVCLIRISGNGIATLLAPLSDDVLGNPIADISSIAFSNTGQLYGFDATTNELVLIDVNSGVVTVIGVVNVGGVPLDIVGLDFVNGVGYSTLYGVTANGIYTISPVTGSASPGVDLNLPGPNDHLGGTRLTPVTISGLTAIPGSPDVYATALWGNEYVLMRLRPNPVESSIDVGRIIIGGTIAGQVTTPGSIGVLEMGFLWGDISIARNSQAIISHAGMGGLPGSPFPNVPSSSRITVGGTLQMIDNRAGWVFSGITAENNAGIPRPGTAFSELEQGTDQWTEAARDAAWRRGVMIDTYYDNNSMEHAQFVTHLSGNFTIYGSLGNEVATFTLPSGVACSSDWYGLSMMAGQTLNVDGTAGMFSFFMHPTMKVHLYDASGRWMGSLGYESMEDGGVGSRGSTQKPMSFTAPEAGIYYLVVMSNIPLLGEGYQLIISDATAANIGGINIIGNYAPQFGGILVQRGGNFGGFTATGTSYGGSVRTTGGGNITAFQAGAIGTRELDANSFVSSNNIGRIAATNGSLWGSIIAGEVLTPNANIQNVYVSGILGPSMMLQYTISATGSIGVIEVGGDMLNIVVTANSDGLGLAGHIDLIHVGGNYGNTLTVPTLRHGPGGNVGYVTVGGTIYCNYGNYLGPVTETTITDGRVSTLRDDGGGTLVIQPTWGQSYNPVTAEYYTGLASYSYCYIGVDDAVGGVGGVIANLRIYGSAILTASGGVEIVNLDLTGADGTSNIQIRGSGTANIYYLTGSTTNPMSFANFSNTTRGNLLSGTIGSAGIIRLGGSIGDLRGHTGAWLFGSQVAPITPDKYTEPQYGWMHGMINGLDIDGNVGEISVGGALGDLRVQGKVNKIVVNSDTVITPGNWDGVNGLVWLRDGANSISLGSGLADDGAVDRARAAILANAPIGSITITGPRYVRDGVVFNEINGAIIVNYLDYPVFTPAIGRVTGTNGATCTAIIAAMGLNGWQPFSNYFGDFVYSAGSIGTVSFSGVGAQIHGAEVYGYFIGTVSTSADSNGITGSYFTADRPNPNINGIHQILAGGPGLYYSTISVNGGNIGTVAGVGATADIIGSLFISTDGMVAMRARDIILVGTHMPGTVQTVAATRDMTDCNFGEFYLTMVGGIGRMTIGRDFLRNNMIVAGTVGTITIGGTFADSSLILQGPAVANLVNLTVRGNISGAILSAGRIGRIVSTTGTILADVTTQSGGWNNDIDLISAAQGFLGSLNVAGNLKSFVSKVSLSLNPGEVFNVVGNLLSFQLGVAKQPAAHLYSDVNVGGNIGTVNITGNLYGQISGNGNLTQLSLGGSLGGDDGGGLRGGLTILGSIGQIILPANSDILGNIIAGTDIKSITLNGGSVFGDITSRNGTVHGITLLRGGNLGGDITGVCIGKIAINGGDVTGNISALGGKIGSFSMVGGTLDADITATDGTIDVLKLTRTVTTAGRAIVADKGFGTITVSDADLEADIVTDAQIKAMTLLRSNLHGNVSAGLGITTMRVTGDVDGSTIAVRTGIANLTVTGSLINSIVASLSDLGNIAVTGNVVDSFVLAGYGVGADMLVGGGDDTLNTGGITKVLVKGTMTGSVVAAGVGPGVDEDYFNLATNELGGGTSNILTLTVTGGFGPDWSTSAILANGSIQPLFKSKLPAGHTLTLYETTPVFMVGGGAVNFGPQSGNGNFFVTASGMRLTLIGDGTANFDEATGQIILNGTTSRSSLTLNYTGGVRQTVSIDGPENTMLSTLNVVGNIEVGDLHIDSCLKTLTIPFVVNGAVWTLGSVVTARVGAANNLTVDIAGNGGTWTFAGGYAAGSFTSDTIKNLTVNGALGANVNVEVGTSGIIKVAGHMTGNLMADGTVTSLMVGGNLLGDVTVARGDLLTFSVTGFFSSAVNVFGAIRGASVGLGFGANASLRAGTEVMSLTVRSGGMDGLFNAGTALRTLAVRGDVSGRIYAGSITTIMVNGSLQNALITAGGNIGLVTINGDMTGSYLLAGFNPGDAGFDPMNGGDAANLMIDAFVPGMVNANNADVLGCGDIRQVTITGHMIESAIGAGFAPGADGYLGTADDVSEGTGSIGRVTVNGFILGDGNNAHGFGVFASSNMPTVTSYRQVFVSNGNAWVGTVMDVMGNLTVSNVLLSLTRIEVTFNHAVNFSSVNTNTFTIISSEDNDFTTLGDNVNISLSVPNFLSYDQFSTTLSFNLSNSTWLTLPGNYFRLMIDGDMSDGSAVTDSRGVVLDGEFTGLWPTGNGTAGGDFIYDFSFVGVNLATVAPGQPYVPAYIWYHGCVPTSGAMVLAYYDAMPQYSNLFDGDASTMTQAVMDLIASPEHIADYALYTGYDDSGQIPFPDMSSINPAGAHVDNSLADFMLTSRSAYGLTYGGTLGGDDADGMDSYITWRGYQANVEYALFGSSLTWDRYVYEINQGRPVMLGVDVNGDGLMDHEVAGAAYRYDPATGQWQYGAYNTWSDQLNWYQWRGVGAAFGIGDAVFVEMVA